jgi:hypothetical protein
MKIHMTRDDGHEVHDLGLRRVSPEAGMYSVLKYELGYGATVQSISEAHVRFRTPIFGKTDYTHVTFDSDEEMKLMFTMLRYWFEAVDSIDMDAFAEEIIRVTGGNAFLVVHGGNLLLGEKRVRRTLLLCVGLADKPEVVERLKGKSEEDIVAVAELVREGNTWEEALEALG